MLRYKTETRPGLVALYDIRPGNGAGPFLQPRSLGLILISTEISTERKPEKSPLRTNHASNKTIAKELRQLPKNTNYKTTVNLSK